MRAPVIDEERRFDRASSRGSNPTPGNFRLQEELMGTSTSALLQSHRYRRLSCSVVVGLVILCAHAGWAGWGSVPALNVSTGVGTGQVKFKRVATGVTASATSPTMVGPSVRIPCCGSGGVTCTTQFASCARPPTGASPYDISQVLTLRTTAGWVWKTAFCTTANGDSCDNAQLNPVVTPVSPLASTSFETTGLVVTPLINDPSLATYDVTIHWMGTDAGTAQLVRFIQFCQDIPAGIVDIKELESIPNLPAGCLQSLATVFSPNVNAFGCTLGVGGCEPAPATTPFPSPSPSPGPTPVAFTCPPGAGFCIGGPNDDSSCAALSECPGGVCFLECNTQCVGGASNGNSCFSSSDCPGGTCSSGWDQTTTISFVATSDTSKIYFALDGVAVTLPAPVPCTDRSDVAFPIDGTLNDYVLFASESLLFSGSLPNDGGARGRILGGNVGVNGVGGFTPAQVQSGRRRRGQSQPATPQPRLRFGPQKVFMSDGTQVVSDTAWLTSSHDVAEVFVNTLKGSPRVFPRTCGPTRFDCIDPQHNACVTRDFPSCQDFSPGRRRITVAASDTKDLAPGTYGDVRVGDGGVLNLSAGIYALRSLVLGKNVTVNTTDQTDVRIAQRMSMGTHPSIGPACGAKFCVRSDNASGGSGGSSVGFNRSGAIHGQWLVPNGDVDLGTATDITGRVWARTISSGFNVNATYCSPN